MRTVTQKFMYFNTCSSAGSTVEGVYELLGGSTGDRLREFTAPALLQFALCFLCIAGHMASQLLALTTCCHTSAMTMDSPFFLL